MIFQIPVDTLFTQVFGVAGPLIRKYHVKEDESKPADAKYNVILEQEEDDDDTFQSNLGTPVQFPMSFVGGSYNIMNQGVIEKTTVGGMRLPYTSIASFTRAKRLTETYMSGYKGSVIEQYGFEPWSIRIQGFIIKNNDYKVQNVADQVTELQKYEELCDAIEVKGKVFEILKINRVAIMSINYPEARNLDANIIKPYEINLKSVEPIELILP